MRTEFFSSGRVLFSTIQTGVRPPLLIVSILSVIAFAVLHSLYKTYAEKWRILNKELSEKVQAILSLPSQWDLSNPSALLQETEKVPNVVPLFKPLLLELIRKCLQFENPLLGASSSSSPSLLGDSFVRWNMKDGQPAGEFSCVQNEGENPYVLISFRGSATRFDWEQDIECSPIAWEAQPEAKVHKGFKSVVHEPLMAQSETLEQKIKEFLARYSPDLPIYIVGHSLGAAVGSLVAYSLMQAGRQVICAAIAVPKVGNDNFVEDFKKKVEETKSIFIRLANSEDPVVVTPVTAAFTSFPAETPPYESTKGWCGSVNVTLNGGSLIKDHLLPTYYEAVEKLQGFDEEESQRRAARLPQSSSEPKREEIATGQLAMPERVNPLTFTKISSSLLSLFGRS